MGVYINMEMPKDCWHCRMFCNCFACEGYNCHCAALGKDIGDENEVPHNKRRDDCPLVPIPPHGRLIDADALYESCALDTNIDVMASAKRINEYMQLKVDEAPTIIPAEEDTDFYTKGHLHIGYAKEDK